MVSQIILRSPVALTLRVKAPLSEKETENVLAFKIFWEVKLIKGAPQNVLYTSKRKGDAP